MTKTPPKNPLCITGAVPIGEDELCRCDCGAPCPLGKKGIENRCTKSELESSGYQTTRIANPAKFTTGPVLPAKKPDGCKCVFFDGPAQDVYDFVIPNPLPVGTTLITPDIRLGAEYHYVATKRIENGIQVFLHVKTIVKS